MPFGHRCLSNPRRIIWVPVSIIGWQVVCNNVFGLPGGGKLGPSSLSNTRKSEARLQPDSFWNWNKHFQAMWRIPLVPGRAGGGSFEGNKPCTPKKIPIECARSLRFQSGGVLAVAGCVGVLVVVMWCAVPWCGMMSCAWLQGELSKCAWLWGEAMWVVASWNDMMLCDVTCCYVLWCAVLWCAVMWLCDVVGCEVMAWCGVVVWRGELGGDVLWTMKSPCHSKTLETFIPMRDATMGCKTL